MPYINSKAEQGTYAHIVGTKETGIDVPRLMEYVVYPMAKKLDKEIEELREQIAKISAKVATPRAGSTPKSQRRQRKTRKSRK